MKFKTFSVAIALQIAFLSPLASHAATLPQPSNASADIQGTDIVLNFSGIAGNNYIAGCREIVNGQKGSLTPFKTGYTSPIIIKNLKANSSYRCYLANNSASTKNWDNVQGSDADTTKFDWIQVFPAGYTQGGQDLLFTKTKSSSPSNVKAWPAASSVAIFFDYPSGAQSVSANCLLKTGGGQISMSSESSPIVLLGANPGSAYSCSLTATYLNGVNSTPTQSVEVTVPQSGTGLPFAPDISSVYLKNNQLVVTVVPPFNGSSITSFNATCVNPTNNKSYSNTSTNYKVLITVDELATYNCTASSQGPYGRSTDSRIVSSVLNKSGSSASLKYKIESATSTGSLVTLTAPFDVSVVSVKFTCKGQSTGNYGKEVWALAIPNEGKAPSAKLDLLYGEWGCSYQYSTNTGLGLESSKTRIAVTLPAPVMKVSGSKLTASKPNSWIGAWSVVCTSADSTQVIKASTTNSVTLSLSRGSWKCAGSFKGQITSVKSIKI